MSSSAAHASLLLNQAQEILLLVDASSLCIRAASTSALRQLGYSEAQLIDRPITDIECALADVFFWEEIRSGANIEARDVEGLYQCADGTTLAVVKSVERAPSDPAFLVIRARDISALKQTEEELAQLTSHLRATLEATVDGIVMQDREGRVVNMNRRFAQLWQLSDNLLLRHNDRRLLAHLLRNVKDTKTFRHRLAHLPPNESAESFDTLLLRDGRVFECSSRPARHAEQIIGRVFCFTDVTERHHAELALIAARDEAKAGSRAKGEFLAMMSHEIRTPMNGIVGMSQLLETTELNGEQLEFAQTIRRSSEALLEIINDILDYSKIEARKLRLETTPFDLSALLSDIEKLFVIKIKESQLYFRCEAAENLPMRLIGDPVRLRQVLVNLVGNALKFTTHGGICLRVLLETDAPDHIKLRFSVHDTGIGIAADKRERIFTPFEQADMSTTRRYGGTGLGLSICRMLCDMMQGEIGVNSVEGQGSEFWFTAQFSRLPAGSTIALAQSQGLQRQSFRADTRILLVEDNPVNRTVLSNLLRKLGAQHITQAVNGKEALACCEQAPFDLIMMDTHMPEMDGLEATLALRAGGNDTYVIGVSADAMQEDREIALQSGMNDYITKPVSLDSLSAGIERWRQTLRQPTLLAQPPIRDSKP